MNENSVVSLRQKDEIDDPLTEILRAGARKLIVQAVEIEFDTFLALNARLVLPDGRQRVVRHGHDPVRTIQTGLARSKCKSRKLAIAPRRQRVSAFASLGDLAEMGATNEEPRCAPAGALSARDFGRRFPGGTHGLARQGRAEPLAGGDRPAQGRVGRRVSAVAKAAICRRAAMSTSGQMAFICRRGWSHRPNACWC